MNEIREIVTKAVVGKGKKKFNLVERVNPANKAFSVLGCWIINNDFRALKSNSEVNLKGSFEINIWYSYDNNSKTDVTKKVITYSNVIPTTKVVNDTLGSPEEVTVRMLQQPTCVDAKITGDSIEVEVIYEVVAEVIGETKMKVTVFDQSDQYIEEEDFDLDIDENFISEV
ncbi:outer spore coat protein CotE [Mycoplasmatota bacterium zrk1]